jgi:ABC-type bacteriocin/lantibiotic exporter with double-glycine peptidase domain
MALQYLGVEVTQSRLNRPFETQPWGAPFSRLDRLARLGIKAAIQAGDRAMVEHAIDSDLPIIAFVSTRELPYWRDSTQHAVVVVGYDEHTVFLSDPAFAEAPQRVGWGEFLLAWGEFDYFCALLRRQSPL